MHNHIQPHIIPQDVELLVDTAPKERWNVDILTPTGYVNLMQIFDYIKQNSTIR